MRRLALAAIALPLFVSPAPAQSEDTAACAATLPKVTPGANLRDLVTAGTRSLAMSGSISRSTARDSVTAAGQCLQRAGS